MQELTIHFKVKRIELAGPSVWLEHKGGEVRVRKQDIKQYAQESFFVLEVKPRP